MILEYSEGFNWCHEEILCSPLYILRVVIQEIKFKSFGKTNGTIDLPFDEQSYPLLQIWQYNVVQFIQLLRSACCIREVRNIKRVKYESKTWNALLVK